MTAESLGFDGNLAAHATASLPLYAALFAFVKSLEMVPRRVEMLVAVGATAGLNAAIAVGGDTAKLFPALSTATVGAVLAMVLHATATKRD
jgi:hypothetical protein